MQLTPILFFLTMAVARSSGARFVHSEYNTDCSKFDFKSIPTDCCKKPLGNVFPPKRMESVFSKCRGSAKMLEWVNSYKLNTLQRLKVNNFIDVTDKSIVWNLCRYGAFVECVFKQKRFLDASGDLDVSAIFDSVYEDASGETWKEIVVKTFYSIHPITKSAYNIRDIVVDEFEQIKCPSGDVNLLPLMMTQMLQSEFTWMCPQQAWYTESNNCTARMWDFKYCDGLIYSMQRRGVFYFPSA